ncbi:MAG: LysM peptidoglycan-binding domain-containing protein [Microscillaceae bacterium]|nr:LysM peptidoglycan-binding domain-containing protein [Microscillaceae bacterium]MDW8461705.1 LysM peptidoglycan-binding domain-containing protein [Cytophagales bacterium]
MITYLIRLSFLQVALLFLFVSQVNGTGKFPPTWDTVFLSVPSIFEIGNMRCILTPDLQNKIRKQVYNFLTTQNLSALQVMAERQALYLPIIEQCLKEQKLPTELKYIAIVETQYLREAYVLNPIYYVLGKDILVRSFLITTNAYIDDRKHPKIMTQKVAYKWKNDNYVYQNWLITMLKFFLQENFETYLQNYFPNASEYKSKTTFIVNDKMPQPIIDYFVFRVLHTYFFNNYPPKIQFHTIQLPSHTQLSLRKIAKQYQTDVALIKKYNPWLLAQNKFKLPTEYELYLPKKIINPDSISYQSAATKNANQPNSKQVIVGFTQEDILMPKPVSQENIFPTNNTIFIEDLKIDFNANNPENDKQLANKNENEQHNSYEESNLELEEQNSTITPLPTDADSLQKPTNTDRKQPKELEKPRTHTVTYGENLYKIARMYNISIADLRRWNGMSATQTLIIVGQVLHVAPPENTALQPVSLAKNHIVKEGENLYQISRRYNIPLEKLMQLNNIENYEQASLIKVGQVIRLEETTQSTIPKKYSPHILQQANTNAEFYRWHIKQIQQNQLVDPALPEVEKKWIEKTVKNAQKFFKVSSTLPKK